MLIGAQYKTPFRCLFLYFPHYDMRLKSVRLLVVYSIKVGFLVLENTDEQNGSSVFMYGLFCFSLCKYLCRDFCFFFVGILYGLYAFD